MPPGGSERRCGGRRWLVEDILWAGWGPRLAWLIKGEDAGDEFVEIAVVEAAGWMGVGSS